MNGRPHNQTEHLALLETELRLVRTATARKRLRQMIADVKLLQRKETKR